MSKAIQFKKNGENFYPCPYMPIGSIYTSTNNINPSTYFGGTWERFGNGRTLVGVDENQSEFNIVSKTGGNKKMQSHYHDIRYGSSDGNGVTISNVGSGVSVLNVQSWAWQYNGVNRLGQSGSNLYTSSSGVGNSENLQPYITVYFWRRIK